MLNQGFVRFIILLIIAIIVLGYFGINIKDVFKEGGTVRDNITFVWQAIRYVWNNYLTVPATYLWNIFYNLLWRSFVENADRIRQGKTPTLLEGQPEMPKQSQPEQTE